MQAMTITKVFPEIPFAHRQHNHSGHCAFIHGHNWTIEVTFGCRAPDENNFVIDFGKLGFLKEWISANLDHAFVVNKDDPELHATFMPLAKRGVFKLFVVPSGSAEGLAMFLHSTFSTMVDSSTKGRVFVVSVRILEDSRNSAHFPFPHTT
jgi:6-pyruvoyltetrahydropterin/6-carboxytetrahydropterin synthase